MEILRNFLGNLSSGVIRLLVTVGILAAVAFLIVRPALDTTKQISKEANESFEKSFKGFGKNGAGYEDVQKTIEDAGKRVQREVKRSFHVVETHSGPGNPKKLVKCIDRAAGNVHRIQRCAAKF